MSRYNEKLVQLLLDLFSADELEWFARSVSADVADRLPGRDASMKKRTIELVEILGRDGRIDPSLFARLTSERPGRADDIARARDAWMRDGQLEDPRSRYLAVSLNGDALVSTAELWTDRYGASKDHAPPWHLDLQTLLDLRLSDRAPPEVLRAARRACNERIAALGIADHGHDVPLEVAFRAQLPLVLWLGLRLRHLRRVTAFNFFGGRYTPFAGPVPVVRPRGTGALELLVAEEHPPDRVERRGEAVVLVDLIPNRTRPADLDQFPAGVCGCESRTRIRLRDPAPLRPEQLAAALGDVIEVLHGLRGQGVGTIHLGLATADVAAFFLGQQLHAWGPIELYDHDLSNHRYLQAFDLYGTGDPP